MDKKITFTGDVNTYSKVAAIKGFRMLTGFGLKESKEFIEAVVAVGSKHVSFNTPPPTETLSSANRIEEGTTSLREALFTVAYAYSNDNRDKVLKELKKLIKMAVENDQNDIAIALLSARDELD